MDSRQFGDPNYLIKKRNKYLLKGGLWVVLLVGLMLSGKWFLPSYAYHLSMFAALLTLPAASQFARGVSLAVYRNDLLEHQVLEIRRHHKNALLNIVIYHQKLALDLECAIVTDSCLVVLRRKERKGLDHDIFKKTLSDFMKNKGFNMDVQIYKDYEAFIVALATMDEIGEGEEVPSAQTLHIIERIREHALS